MAQFMSYEAMVKKCLQLLDTDEDDLSLWWPNGNNGVRVRLKSNMVTYIFIFDSKLNQYYVMPYKEWKKKQKGAKKK